jgi:hypothetical protein
MSKSTMDGFEKALIFLNFSLTIRTYVLYNRSMYTLMKPDTITKLTVILPTFRQRL